MEKFLELNSEQNHDDYCLAYVFTDRDFDDGVLGLAWVGAPSGNVQRNKQMQMFAVMQRGVLCSLMLALLTQRRADASDCSNPQNSKLILQSDLSPG